MTTEDDDAFREILAELADGKRWQLIRTDGWEEFSERLSNLIVTLPPRRRQALVMLLFALSERMVTPEATNAWMADHDLATDEELEALIAWLRQFRPPST